MKSDLRKIVLLLNQLYEKISTDKNSTAWHQLACLVANRALVQALPALDLILTPNGFGVVNNANVVPASRDRVDRLLASLLAARDRALDFLLDSPNRPQPATCSATKSAFS